MEIPDEFKRLVGSNTINQAYLSAMNADRRTALEQKFMSWVDNNNLYEELPA